MKSNDRSLLSGLLLIGMGLLFLLTNLGLIGPIGGAIWALLFGIGGVGFLGVYMRDRAHWWALIPGCALLGLGALVGYGALLPGAPTTWGGSLFLGAISLSFWLIFLLHREQWWALIPGGTLLTLAAIAGLDQRMVGEQAGALLFYGLGLTFGLVYLTSWSGARRSWALIPAGIMLVMGLIIQASFGAVLDVAWPVALIAAGLYMGLRTLIANRAPLPAGPAAPAPMPPADPLVHVERLVNDAVERTPVTDAHEELADHDTEEPNTKEAV